MPAGAFFLEYFVKGLTKYSRGGLLGEICDKLRIHCRMQFFEKISQKGLNHDLRPELETRGKMLQILVNIMDLGDFCVEL